MIKRIRIWIKHNELFCQLFLVVNLFILIVGVATGYVAYVRSKDTYLKAYMTSSELLMDKVHDDYVRLNENVNRIMSLLDGSQYIKTFLRVGNSNTANSLAMKEQMADTRMALGDIPTNLILLGTNGITFFQNSGVRNEKFSAILEEDFIKKSQQSKNVNDYYYLNGGYTTSTRNQPGWLFVHKIYDQRELLGYAMIFITESHLSSIYTKLFNPELHNIVVIDQDNRVISAGDKSLLTKTYQLKNHKYVLEKPLYGTHFKFINVIDESKLIQSIQLIQPIILIVAATSILVSLVAFFYIRRTTRPIYHLLEKIPSVNEGDFSQKVVPEGTYEILELGKAYNTMLDELDLYFQRLLITEKEKRLAEIRSLQMQIQPHFIFNTLASIKFLIWQKKNDSAAEAIDEFIILLRQTLRGANETIPLSEELAGVKAYTKILELRYGDNIQTTFFIAEEANELLVPKMLIQPIIENAYLYAFPEQQEGFIQIFARVNQKDLIIEIMDNGIGFDQSVIKQANRQAKKSNYSGIGLQNINERVQLLYGTDYGLKIISNVGTGTRVILKLPINNKQG